MTSSAPRNLSASPLINRDRQRIITSLPVPFLMLILAVICLAEIAIMFLMPVIVPAHMRAWGEAIFDAVLLVLVLAPILWYLLVRPLHGVVASEYERASAIVKGALDGIITVDADWSIRSVNPAAERIFGYAEEELAGKPVTHLLPERDRPIAHGEFQRLRSTGQSRFFGKAVEVRGLRKGGTEFPGDLSMVAYRTSTGSDGYAGFIRETTERRRDRRELQRLRRAVDASGEVIFLTDPSGVIEFVNQAFTQVYGYAAQEVIGRATPRILKSGRTRPDEYDAFWKTITAKHPVTRTFVNRSKDGRLIDIETSINPVLDDRGVVQGFLAIQRDVTERTNAEAILRRSESRYRTLVENLPQSVFLKDTHSVYVSVNERYARDLKMTALEVSGKTDFDLFPDELARQYRADDARIMASGKGEELEETYIKDGQRSIVHTVKVPVTDAGGQLIGVLGIFWDVTERKRLEVLLRVSEERMRFALESSHVGIWEADLKTDVTHWSEICEVMHGLPPGAFGGNLKAFIECIHPEDRDHVQTAMGLAMREHQEPQLEYRTVWPDGTEHRIQSIARFYYDDSGSPVRGAGISMDITSRWMLEEQLRQAQKMEAIGQLAGGIAHDFNNVLTAVLGYSDLVLPRVVDRPDVVADVAEIKDAAERAARLTQQILAFSRKSAIILQVLNLNDVLSHLETMLRRIIGEDLRLVITSCPSLASIKVDRGQIEQVLVNLVVNARDAMPRGGTVTIEIANVTLDADFVRRHVGSIFGDCVSVTVRDTGRGIPPDVLKHIFEPFFTTKGTRGTGLGLATVYGIVKRSGGYITVDSTPGTGTCFTIYLPQVAGPLDTRTPIAPAATGHRGSETILVVEDEAFVRGLIRRVLEPRGYVILSALDVIDALAIASRHPGPIHLLLTDVIMPDLQGPELAERVRSIRPGINVLYVSGFTGNEAVDAISTSKEAGFLRKPFTPDTLLSAVRERLAGRTARPSDS